MYCMWKRLKCLGIILVSFLFRTWCDLFFSSWERLSLLNILCDFHYIGGDILQLQHLIKRFLATVSASKLM